MRCKLDALIAGALAMAILVVASTALVYAGSALAKDQAAITSIR